MTFLRKWLHFQTAQSIEQEIEKKDKKYRLQKKGTAMAIMNASLQYAILDEERNTWVVGSAKIANQESLRHLESLPPEAEICLQKEKQTLIYDAFVSPTMYRERGKQGKWRFHGENIFVKFGRVVYAPDPPSFPTSPSQNPSSTA